MDAYLHLKNLSSDPPGGWYFIAATGHEVRDAGYRQLEDAVRRHLRSNGIEVPPNLWEVIEDQICRRVPASFVREPIFNRYPRERTIVDTTRRVVREIRTAGIKPDLEQIAERTMVCAECKWNKWRHGCYECGMAHKLATGAIGAVMNACGNVKGCDTFYSLIGPLACLDKDAISKLFSKVPDEEIPEHCWVRSLKDGQ